jgi:hypothetical protein
MEGIRKEKADLKNICSNFDPSAANSFLLPHHHQHPPAVLLRYQSASNVIKIYTGGGLGFGVRAPEAEPQTSI